MKLLRVCAEGAVTSFRYPHFIMGRHPTFEMPPPSTIYGHICSALGRQIDPAEVRFGYSFKCEGRIQDLEHIHLVSETTGFFTMDGQRYPKRAEGNVNPFRRDLLVNPRLTLYLDRPEWLEAFRSPYFAVVLGRSQDLFAYTAINVIDAPVGAAYLEHTLLPFSFAGQNRGISVVMPRFVDVERGREVQFEPYRMLMEAQPLSVDMPLPLDPDSPVRTIHGVARQRGILLHEFVASGATAIA